MALANETREVLLRDRRMVRVRALRPNDRNLYERAVVDLSPRSRYLRFLAPIAKPSERLLDQMTQTDGFMHVAHLALTADETAGVGVVRYVRSPADPQIAETAIAVADDWQGYGLGVELLRQTAEHARLAGVEALTATTLRENTGAVRLLRATGFEPVRAGAELYAEYRMPLGR